MRPECGPLRTCDCGETTSSPQNPRKKRRLNLDAIFSIRPHFADAILDGSKTVELRTVAPKKAVERIWVYSSSPVQRIVGFFTPGKIQRATEEDFKKAHLVMGKEDAGRYYAIEVLDPAVIVPPIHPHSDLNLGYVWLSPQSWRYAGQKEQEALRRLAP